ncbi:hypothetical protein [Rubrobacter xylanophilus]|uniref:hypothetical protein n=1 Tax=Rubrobacter xylanophilus TaxID=49319 RepID=UPI0018DE0A6A
MEIRQWNELPVPVSTHLHGGVTPPESDGYPTDLILQKDTSPPRTPLAAARTSTPASSGTASTPTTKGRRRSGTTTTAWTSPARRSTAVSPAST